MNSNHYAAIYDMGSFDMIQEEGNMNKCEMFVKACQDAYDKPLKIVTIDQVRKISYNESEVITGYRIN